jgi:hypothetical protein
MTPGVRKLALTAHVTCSVGWLGAVAGFFALAIAGLTAQDLQTSRASYVAMNLTGWYVIVPLCFASLVTGLLQALGTSWGLLRHHWVVAKLLIAILATVVLMVHMQPISDLGRAAADQTLGLGDHRDVRVQLVADAAVALLVLLVATALSVYKPRGLTRYGWRKQREQRGLSPQQPRDSVESVPS